jgi:hypothetical protein
MSKSGDLKKPFLRMLQIWVICFPEQRCCISHIGCVFFVAKMQKIHPERAKKKKKTQLQY